MTPKRSGRSLPSASVAFLKEELEGISRTRWRDHERQVGRVAITFRPCKQGRDGLADHPVGLNDFRLVALRAGWVMGVRGRRPSWRLGIYRARLDRKNGVTIRFEREQSYELMHPRSLMKPWINSTAIRSAIVLYQALEESEAGDFGRELDWPEFYWGFGAEAGPEFGAENQKEADGAEKRIGELRAWPAEFLARMVGGSLGDIRAKEVFASLAHLKGRVIRNPAFTLMKRHGLLPRHQDYGSWLGTVSVKLNGVRVIHDPESERSETSRLRGLIESHMLADRSREEVLAEDLEVLCRAMGLKSTEGSERLDRLGELLGNPWERTSVPYAGRVQLINLRAQGSTVLSDGLAEVDLDEPLVGVDGSESVRRTSWKQQAST